MTHYTYVLLSKRDERFYVGYAVDVVRRLRQHTEGNVPSTRHRRPLKLVYYELCDSEDDARAREKYLKSGMGRRYLRNRLKYSLKKKSKE